MKNLFLEEIGEVIALKNPLVKIKGLPSLKEGEVVFLGQEKGLIFKIGQEFSEALIEEEVAYALTLGEIKNIKIGEKVKRSYQLLEVPVSEKFLEKIISPLGKDLETEREIKVKEKKKIENLPLPLEKRDLVRQPLETGIKIIDALFPIGRGQRELILGDIKTGKTSLALDIILNQKDKDVISIYCSIGQKKAEVVSILNSLRAFGAKNYIIMASFSSDPIVFQYLAPFSAMTLGEYFRDQGRDVLIIFDDLLKHAWAFREISLLLETPPSRETYPGDIFYLHARLLERAGKSKEGGSITALPICETKEGDITEYIPTNLISVTDGQLYLEKDLFLKGQLPAINIGLSVSRIGAHAQRDCLKETTGGLKVLLSQLEELKKLVQLETKISETSQKIFKRGQLLLEFFKQKKFQLAPVGFQAIIYFAILRGWLDELEIDSFKEFEQRFREFLEVKHPYFLKKIEAQSFTPQLKQELKKIFFEFKKIF